MNDQQRLIAIASTFMWVAASLMLLSIQAKAAPPASGKAEISESKRPVGTWRFRKHNRPVKVVAMGGSSTVYYRGNYTKFMEMACKNVEVKNLGKTGMGIKDLKIRYDRQVASNRHISTRHNEIWVMTRGGLNSIFNPERVNWFLSKLFRSAKKRGFKTLALSLTPWGKERDKDRWWGLKGLESKRATQLTVDYLMGRLDPAKALGRYAKSASWQAGELPDIAVDLFDTDMRTKAAKLRNPKLARGQLTEARWVRKKMKNMAPMDRTAFLDKLVAELVDVPRWHLRKDLRAFDAVHPNTSGHREIAKKACPKLPKNWGCDCALMDRIVWGKKGLEIKGVRTAKAD